MNFLTANILPDIFISFFIAANITFMVYIYFERFHALKEQGQKVATDVLQSQLQTAQTEEAALLAEFKKSLGTIVSSNEDLSQHLLTQVSEDLEVSQKKHAEKFNEFSDKMYQVMLDTNSGFTEEMKKYAVQSYKQIDSWQAQFIQTLQQELTGYIADEKKKLTEFSLEEQKRVGDFVKENANKQTSAIVDEILKNGISLKDQEKLAQEAIEKFFNE